MNREESQILKGVAILFMLYLHLFNRTENVELCNVLLYVDEQPLIQWLANAANPVSFFVILGGYGLYKVYSKGDKNRYKRIWKLYKHYWFILSAFLIIGLAINRLRITSLEDILLNYTGLDTTYNGECWFLLPYSLLSITSPFIFRFTDKQKPFYVIVFSLGIVLCTSFLISRYENYLYGNWLIYQPVLYLHLLFAFLVGAIAARENWIQEITKYLKFGKTAYLLIIVITLLRCYFNTSILNTPYDFGIIVLFLLAPRWIWVDRVLSKLGNKSMDMWFIHSWICYYLFHNELYSLKHPIVIFVTLVMISYGLACVFHFILDKINSNCEQQNASLK